MRLIVLAYVIIGTQSFFKKQRHLVTGWIHNGKISRQILIEALDQARVAYLVYKASSSIPASQPPPRSIKHFTNYTSLTPCQELLLLEGLPEVNTCILGFEGISTALAKLSTLFLKISKDIIAIYLVGVYKVIGFLSYGEAIFLIIDFILIGRVPIVISVYFLYQTLLLYVQYIYIPVILSNIREFLGQSNDRGRGRRGRIWDGGGKVGSDCSIHYISDSCYSLRIHSDVRSWRRSGLRGFGSITSSAIRLLLNLIEAGQDFSGVVSH